MGGSGSGFHAGTPAVSAARSTRSACRLPRSREGRFPSPSGSACGRPFPRPAAAGSGGLWETQGSGAADVVSGWSGVGRKLTPRGPSSRRGIPAERRPRRNRDGADVAAAGSADVATRTAVRGERSSRRWQSPSTGSARRGPAAEEPPGSGDRMPVGTAPAGVCRPVRFKRSREPAGRQGRGRTRRLPGSPGLASARTPRAVS
jgi:hypothetical protein